jgi:hypothetical protein
LSGCRWGSSEEGDEENDDGEERDGVAEGLVRGAGVGDGDAGWACGEGDGDEAVVALISCGAEGAVVCDVPGGVVAKVENEVFGEGRVEGEVRRCGGGLGLGGGFGVGVF